MKINPLCLTLILFGIHQFATAQVFKCKGVDGVVVFQGAPCPSETKLPPRVLPTVGQKAELTSQQKNNGIEGTNWDTTKPKTVVNVPPTAPQYSSLPETQQPPVARTIQTRSADPRATKSMGLSNAEVEQARAFNKANECNQARQQLAVNKESRPIYHYDNNGDKQYVADADRQAHLEAAQQRVNNACN